MNAPQADRRIDSRSEFLALVTGEFCRTQGLDLIRELEAAGIELRDVRAGDAPGRIDFVLEDGVIRQDRTPGWPMLSGWHLVLSGPSEGLQAVGRSVEDAVGAIANYLEEVRPTTLVERALKARRTADERDRADLRTAADRMVIDAYEGLPRELRDAFQTLIAYLALIEEQVGSGGGEVPIASQLHRLMRLGQALPRPEVVAAGDGNDVSTDLRRIVTAHTRVGGYPNTMGIARAAYDLGSSHEGERSAPMRGSPRTDGADPVADAPIDWQGDLVAEHAGGPVSSSPAARKAGTVVAVTVHPADGTEHMSVFGIPGFANGLTVHRSGSSRTHWRIRNARTGEIVG